MIDFTVASRMTATVSPKPVCYPIHLWSAYDEARTRQHLTRLGQILSLTVFLSSLSEYSGRWSSKAIRMPRSALANSLTRCVRITVG